MSYETMVIDYMKRNGSITNHEAFRHIGATRLGAVIFRLRKKGYNIKTFRIYGTTPDGKTVRYARYVFNLDPEQKADSICPPVREYAHTIPPTVDGPLKKLTDENKKLKGLFIPG